MPPLRTIFPRFLVFVGIYMLSILPWPGLREAYAFAFRSGMNAVFAPFGSNGEVRFEAIDPPEPPLMYDTLIAIGNGESTARHEWSVNSRHLGYLSLATLFALIMATPLGWRRRGRAFVVGASLVTLFIVLQGVLVVLNGFAESHPLMVSTPYVKAVIWRAHALIVTLPASWFLAPTIIWGLVCVAFGLPRPQAAGNRAAVDEPLADPVSVVR